MEFAKWLKNFRNSLFMNQQEFAKKLGISYVTISNLERGKFSPSLKVKKRLIKVFKIKPEELNEYIVEE